MKTTLSKCFTLLLVIILGFELTSFSQCVLEENVYAFTYMGKRYEVVKELKTWSEAASCAVERGGYLAEINSEEEQDTIYGAIIHGAEVPVEYEIVSDGGGIAYVWIGATDQQTEGTWIWDGNGDNSGINFWNGQGFAGENNGAPVDELYHNWGGSSSGNPNEPDDYGSGQDGAAIGLAKWPAGIDFTLGVASEWNDINSDNSIYFVVEFDCQESKSTIDETGCGNYVSPSGKTWIISDTYQDTIMNAAGCDSVITINLTIVAPDTSVIQGDETLTSNATGVEYQWLDCNQENTIIEGETNQSFIASSNGNYSVKLTEGVCTDTSACYSVTNLSVEDKSLEERLKIFQQARNTIQIDLGDVHQEIFIKVTDVNGRLVYNKNFVQSQIFSIELDNPAGAYFITVTTETQQAVFKMIKN